MTGADRKIDRNRQARMPGHAGSVSLSARILRPLLMYLDSRGHESKAFLKSQGLDPAIFLDPEARVPHAAAVSLWPAAARMTGDMNLGLHVAEGIRPGSFGILEYVVRTSDTLGMGLQRLSRYHRLMHGAAEVKLAVHHDRAILSHQLPIPGGLPRAVSEFIVASLLIGSRQATGMHWNPLEVRFLHSAPDDVTEYERLFGCLLRFGHSRNELVFPRDLLDAPLIKADTALQTILEAQAAAILEALPRGEAATDAVRRHLAGELGEGQPTLELIAPRLHMSARTLHRRLEEEGTSFREILTEVRREIATRHLVERRLAIGEIAFLLGFSEPSAFHRAFKRWTGHAPLAYRNVAHLS